MGLLVMSEEERSRKAIFEMVRLKQMTLKKSAEQLEISYRQAKRIYKRYQEEGDEGIIHKSRGKKNMQNNSKSAILEIYKEKYLGFGPTLAAEKLQEDDRLKIDHETLRRWLLEQKLWIRQRERKPYRQRREPKAQFGEMIQIDGSIHDWFEDGEHYCLLNMVDDATGTTQAYLAKGETTEAVFRVLWRWITLYGVPLALYVDLKSVYVSPKGSNGYSHVERACQKLNIKIIKAYSPQAKGRVERNHGVYQDRFVKELRLKNIKKEEDANALLENGFIDKLNQKFQKLPKNPVSAHRPLKIELNNALCWDYKRKVCNDWTFSFENQLYQIEKSNCFGIKPKDELCVRKHLDGVITAWFEGGQITIKPIAEKPTKVLALPSKTMTHRESIMKASSLSPWRRYNPDWLGS